MTVIFSFDILSLETEVLKMETTEKKAKSKRGLKALKIIVIVLIVIAVVAAIFIEVTTKPVDENSDKVIAVGGMVTSQSIDYQDESGKGIKNNAVIKIMQMVWRFCSDGDMKKHESQTPPEVDAVYDIAYIDDGNRYHKLDVYAPQGNTEKLPVIIDIHGGGWMYGDKQLNEYYCRALADRGYIVFNVSYRLVPDVTVNEQIQDVAEALKWISENLESYNADCKNVMLTGDSAGGQLAVYETVLLQSAELREIFGTVDAKLDVTALVLTSPVSYMNDGTLSVYTKLLWGKDYKEKATANYMNLDQIIDFAPNMPPTYLITSSGDSLAHDQTVMAYELLQSKGVTCELKDYPEWEGKALPHVFSVLFPFDEIGSQTIDGATDFYNSYCK